jgi:hypothetical protein
MLTEFKGLFREPIFANLQHGTQPDFEIITNPNGTIPLCSPYNLSPREQAELRRQIDKAISYGWIQPSRRNIG